METCARRPTVIGVVLGHPTNTASINRYCQLEKKDISGVAVKLHQATFKDLINLAANFTLTHYLNGKAILYLLTFAKFYFI